MSKRPDMVVRSIEGDRWGELGKRMTPEQREEAVDALLELLNEEDSDERRTVGERGVGEGL